MGYIIVLLYYCQILDMLNIICIPARIRIVFEGIQYAKGIIPSRDLCISFSLIIDENGTVLSVSCAILHTT